MSATLPQPTTGHKRLYDFVRNLPFVLGLLFLSHLSIAQTMEAPARQEGQQFFKLEGMLGVSAGRDVVAVTVGGPNLKLKIGQKAAIGVGAFPSLLFINGKAEPKLGLSPRIDYGNLVFIAPAYHSNSLHKWFFSYGLGYKFH